MNNLQFLTNIKALIIKSNDKYYVRIPFIFYNEHNSYMGNYKNGINLLLTSDLLDNDDLEDLLSNLDNRYEYTLTNELVNENLGTNYKYYANLNNIIDINVDEDDVKHAYQTFMNILKETYIYNNLETTDYLYKYIIDFYSNGQYDEALILMNSIFNNEINITSQNTNCGCNQQLTNCSSNLNSSNSINTGTELINYDNATCIDKYKAAMYQWLQKMLSDTEFYCHWLFVNSDFDDTYVSNEVIINKLIELLEFLINNFDLSQLGKTNNSYCNHSSSNQCGDFITNNELCSNYEIIKNYIEVLKIVKEDKTIENKNKVYIYGKKFAEIFPLLSFN